MPCKGGYRTRIEDGKRRRVQERKYEQSAERTYWLNLVHRVHKTEEGFNGLPKVEKTYYAVSCLIGEVYNGGFDQFFSNSAGAMYAYALDGLFELEAERSAALLIAAKETLFGEKLVPIDRTERVNVMPTYSESSAESATVSARLDVLDKDFYTDPDRLAERREKYANEHALYTAG